MSWGRADAATIHGHHLYGGEGYPSLRYLVNNGVLLNHLEFYKAVRRADTITPMAFLLFLEHLLATDQRLQKLREQLQSEGWFENCKPCKHPITCKAAYLAFSKRREGSLATLPLVKGQRGGAYLPAWLIDEIEAGVSQVRGRVAITLLFPSHSLATNSKSLQIDAS